ncbi:HDAC7 deacetylase, partial [Drymodes brunneopygia]|nr:HDAC7 deacetylase [Drymodes brunneopygia]
QVAMEAPHREAEPGQQEQELRQILNKDKSKRSAVASTVVKQKLAEVILKKQQAALERTSNPPAAALPYRSLEPLDPEGPSPAVLSTFLPPVPSTSLDPPEHFPLRKTASEPNLKVRCKPRKCLDRRKNPLTRKESAPPSLKRRPPEAIGESGQGGLGLTTGSRSPPPGCPQGVWCGRGGVGWVTHETPLAQRLMMQESSLAQFALQSAASLPAITLGLPATTSARGEAERRALPSLAHRVPVLNGPVLPGGHSPVFIPAGLEQHEPGSPLSPRLQPVIILEPSVTHAPLVAVPGLGTVPFSFAPPLIPAERLSLPGHHKPLGRTRSEPLPQSPKAIQQHLVFQQHHAHFLERLKQQTHLGKRMVKSSEKPRLRQIPSSEDMEAEGTLPEAAAEAGDSSRSRPEPPRPGSSGKEPERTQKMGQPQEELVLQQALLWDSFQRVQQQLLKRQPLADPPVVPPGHAGHRPLSRAQSSPATATVSLPAQDTKALSLPVQEQPPKPHFTTGTAGRSRVFAAAATTSCGCAGTAGRATLPLGGAPPACPRGHRRVPQCLRGRKATLEELQCVHSERHVLLYGTNPLNRLKLDNGKLAGILSQRTFVMLPCGGVGVSSASV